jgi:hypothetical protein
MEQRNVVKPIRLAMGDETCLFITSKKSRQFNSGVSRPISLLTCSSVILSPGGAAKMATGKVSFEQKHILVHDDRKVTTICSDKQVLVFE